ncbi:MAG: hypothetical protein M3137_20450 [Actinomycetota bacterium]|nr:hypothetical protein [Actinomycetota bacterium]
MSDQDTVPSARPPAPGEVVVLQPPAGSDEAGEPAGTSVGVAEALTRRPRSVLDEERDFFLRSLRDLEVEHEAGDIDDTDYDALKDDYTVRAAAVIRQLDADRVAVSPSGATTPGGDEPSSAPPEPAWDGPSGAPTQSGGRPRWRRWVGGVVVAVAAGSLAGWAVTRASGSRLPGQTVSGIPVGAEKVAQLLDQSQKAAASGDAVTALKDCRTILADNPNQPQALAEEGWVLAQTQQPALQSQGLNDLTRAVALAPGDQTAHLYRGIVLLDVGRRSQAVGDLQWYLDHHPDPQVKPRVEAALTQAGGPPGLPGAPSPSPAPASPTPAWPPAAP